MKYVCMIVICAILLLQVPDSVHAASDDENIQFLKSMNLMNDSIRRMDFHSALFHLNHMFNHFSNLSYSKKITVEGMHALSLMLVQMKYELVRAKIEPEHVARANVRLKIAFNAAIQSDTPLFLSVLHMMVHQLNQLNRDNVSKDVRFNSDEVRKIKLRWDSIEPALSVVEQPSTIVRISSIIAALKNRTGPSLGNISSIDFLLKSLSDELTTIRAKYDSSVFLFKVPDSVPTFATMMLLITFIILGSVAFRKFRIANH